MSVIVINSNSPEFVCSSPACYIDAESIDTSYVYDSNYVSSCDTVGSIPYSGGSGTVGPAGPAGADGVGIDHISGPVTVDLVDTYTIHYTDATTTTFDVTNGADGDTPVITVGTVTTGAPGTNVIITNSGVAPDATFNFTIPRGDVGAAGAGGTDGATIYTGTGVPAVGLGYNDDLYLDTASYNLYKKASGSWSVLVNIQGAAGAAGTNGTNGVDGDQWTYGSGEPVDLTVETFDSYYIDTDTNNIWYKAEGANNWGAAAITNLNGDSYYTTSTTSITLTSLSIGDPVNIVTASSTMSYSPGQFLVVSNSYADYFLCKVTTYAGTALAVEVVFIKQTLAGALASWIINLGGVVESEALPDWYEITATAGTGTVASRTFTGPTGWIIGAGNVYNVTGAPNSQYDLTIEHNTGFKAVDCVVYINDGSIYQKANTPKSYGTMYADLTDAAIQLSSFCTETQALRILVKLV